MAQAQHQIQTITLTAGRKPDHVAVKRSSTEDAAWSRNWGNQATQHLLHSGIFQAKLKVSQPDDPHEEQADRIAHAVMRMPLPDRSKSLPVDAHRPGAQIGGLCRECEEGELQRNTNDGQDRNKIQTSALTGSRPEIAGGVQAQFEAVRGAGRPLPGSVRAFFEPRFGYDLSTVRIHTDNRAAHLARAINALAFTMGPDVVIDPARYAPEATEGRRLLAHELTHVIQQTRPSRSQSVGAAGSANQQVVRGAGQRAHRTIVQLSTEPFARVEAQIQRQPTFSPECTSYHRCNVIEPLVHSKEMVDATLAELPAIADGSVTSGRIIDLLNVHFHTATAANAQTILDNFRTIRAELDASIQYVCHTDNPPDCEATPTGFVGGFTNCAAGADVHLCSLYHVGLDCEEQARVLVHEVAHHVPGFCADHAYVGDSEYMSLPSDKAMVNADTYAQFAKMVFLGSPSCKDCGTEIQIRGRRY